MVLHAVAPGKLLNPSACMCARLHVQQACKCLLLTRQATCRKHVPMHSRTDTCTSFTSQCTFRTDLPTPTYHSCYDSCRSWPRREL